MANRTVRAIFDATVGPARKGMSALADDVDKAGRKVDDLTKDLKVLDATKVKPEIDVKIDDAKKRLSDLTRELGELKKQPASPEVDLKIDEAKKRIVDVRAEIKDLTSQRTEVRIDAGIKDAKKAIASITNELGLLRTLEVTPQVTADIKDAQRRMREARAILRDLNGAKAELTVTADTGRAENAVDDLKNDIGAAGREGGAEAGDGVATGILDALRTIPIAGAVVGVGAALGGALILAVKQGMDQEAQRDLFSARTGLDEATAARFGRAAGEAYANAYGESVAGNLDVAKQALAGGLIDADATDAEIENVIAKLTSIQTLFDYDISGSVRGVSNLIRTGLVRSVDEAFDLITVASQKVPSDDLLDTLTEYSSQWVTLGLTGKSALGLIVQGAEAGARDTDKVADSLKELGLRVREGTDPAKKALKDLRLDAGDIIDDFQEGGPRAAAAVGKIFDALRDMEERGGNTQSVIANLFGGPGEDLGAALFALDVDKANAALDGTAGAAGAADRALATMADNQQSKIESAQRNIEVAANGIKGALADAFSDDIEGAADWVSKNREQILQFFVDVVNGAIDAGLAFAEFSATALDGVASLSDGFADLLDSIEGSGIGKLLGIDAGGAADTLRDMADSAREGAKAIRDEVPDALEEVRGKVNAWAAPELLKARLHDATTAMAQDMDDFSKVVEQSGGTVKINGDKKDADEVLAELTENINEQDGTVTINGDAVPAEDALNVLMALIDAGAGNVRVGAQTSPAQAEVDRLKGRIGATEARVTVTASTAAAERALADLERARYATLNIRVAGVNSVGGLTKGTYDGGLTGVLPGRYAGGRVPGRDVGYDNVLWPLHRGGQTLLQPLGGGEMVINSQATSKNLALLEAINAGFTPGSHSESHDLNAEHVTIVTRDARSFRRDLTRGNYQSKSRFGR